MKHVWSSCQLKTSRPKIDCHLQMILTFLKVHFFCTGCQPSCKIRSRTSSICRSYLQLASPEYWGLKNNVCTFGWCSESQQVILTGKLFLWQTWSRTDPKIGLGQGWQCLIGSALLRVASSNRRTPWAHWRCPKTQGVGPEWGPSRQICRFFSGRIARTLCSLGYQNTRVLFWTIGWIRLLFPLVGRGLFMRL